MKKWLLASRPKTLLASISPVLLGSIVAYSDGHFDILISIILFISAILLQILTNFANDYYDFIKGADTVERIGPVRAVQSGSITPKAMKNAVIIVVFISLLFGSILTYLTSYWILVIGIFSIIFAILYTAGPFALAYKGLGELFVFIFFGPIAVTGSYYCYTLQTPWYIFYLSIPAGCISTVILLTNNIRDYEIDKRLGKNTFVVRIGLTFSKLFYTLLLLIAFAIPLFFVKNAPLMPIFCMLPALGVSRSIAFIFKYKNPVELNALLGKNSLLLFFYSLAISLGYYYSHV